MLLRSSVPANLMETGFSKTWIIHLPMFLWQAKQEGTTHFLKTKQN